MCQTAVSFISEGKNAWKGVFDTNCDADFNSNPSTEDWPAAVKSHSMVSQEQLINAGRKKFYSPEEKIC